MLIFSRVPALIDTCPALPPSLFVTVMDFERFLLPYPVLISLVRFLSWKPFYVCGSAYESFDINARSPNICSPIQAILNSIKFMVSVPVLSLKTY